MQDKSGKCLAKEPEILNKCTEYCYFDLNNYETIWDSKVLDYPQIPDEDSLCIILAEVETAVKTLKMGKSAGVDKIPAEFVKTGGNARIDILSSVSNTIFDTREWLTMSQVPCYLSSEERKLATVPKLQNHQSNQSSKQSDVEDHLKQTPATSGKDHCKRASWFQVTEQMLNM